MQRKKQEHNYTVTQTTVVQAECAREAARKVWERMKAGNLGSPVFDVEGEYIDLEDEEASG